MNRPELPPNVTVRVELLQWLQRGIEEGWIAPSSYALMDAHFYQELDRAIAGGLRGKSPDETPGVTAERQP